MLSLLGCGPSTMLKSVPATSRGSVYWPRPQLLVDGKKAFTLGRRADSEPDGRLRWLDRVDARHDAPPPGSPSTTPAATPWLSHESMSRKQFLVRCLPARSAFAANADGSRTIRHAASTRAEWNHGLQRRGQSHATTLPPSNGATCRSSAPWKACPVFLVP